MTPGGIRSLCCALALVATTPVHAPADPHAWLPGPAPADAALARRIPPPPGFHRIEAAPGSFAHWLRTLPLRPPGTPVRLFDGRIRSVQRGVHAVVDIDTGRRDLQQCADAVIRLRAEYLRASGREDDLVFRFTSGHPAPWTRWRDGERPTVNGARVTWARRAASDASYRSFRTWLDVVFAYAGSASLARDLPRVADPAAVLPGDAFLQGGYPGHAVLVADVAEDDRGNRAFLLLQSYMPAQDIHVLENPADEGSPWYPVRATGELVTPDWTFPSRDLRRFPESGG